MKSYYSIIRYVNNPLSKENLAIGMIVISGDSIFYKFSNNKIKLAHKINSRNGDILDYTVDKILAFIRNELKNEIKLFPSNNSINVEYLNRLSVYNNGFLQFDKPSALNMEFNKSRFEDFFNKYVEVVLPVQKKKVIDRAFERTIQRVFKDPLKDKINLDFKIKKESVPNLFFDYTVDGIGVNGSIYTLKSIDLNSEKPIDNYRRDISELESLNYRLDLFGERNGLKAHENKHFLLINPYKGSKDSYRDLYEVLKNQNEKDFPYKIIGSKGLPGVTEEFKKANSIKKFTDFISELETV